MAYRFIENMNDIAVEVEAITIEDLFSLSCHAWRDATVESTDVSSTEWKFLYFKAGTLEELLSGLLNEINRLLFSGDWIFNSIDDMKIISEENEIKLYADIYGSPFNPENFTIKQEIKTITINQKQIEKVEAIYKTQILFKL